MKSELKEISPTSRELLIEVDAATVKDAYGKISQRYAKGATVPGFRKGFAPLDVIRVRYKEEIKQEVLQLLLPDKVSEAITEHGLQPLTEPNIHIEDIENAKVNGSEPVKLHVHIEVMPEIALPSYEGLEITKRIKPVIDEDVEDLINRRLSSEAALMPVEDRASQDGDTVIVDLTGTFEDEPDGEPITADDLEVKLGDEMIEASFTDNLVGVRPDEEKEFTVAYPADFSSSALAGRTLHYKAKVKSVGVMETPEPDDEWAKSLEEGFESLADLRSKLRSDMEKMAEADADARVRNELVANLIKDNEFEVPNALVENQARNLLNNFAQDLQQRGVDPGKVEEQFIQMAYTQMRTQAERDVRGALLLEKIAEAEKVEVAEAEVEEELQKMADYYRTTVEEIRSSLDKQGGSGTIENNLKTRKTIEAIAAKAKITDGEWIDENDAEIAEANSEEVSEEADGKKAKTAKVTKPKAKASKAKAVKTDE